MEEKNYPDSLHNTFTIIFGKNYYLSLWNVLAPLGSVEPLIKVNV